MFTSRQDVRRARAIRALKAAARTLFKAGEDDALVVNELSCTEPGCPPIETVVALLRAGSEPRQVKVQKPALDVTQADLRAAIKGLPPHRTAAADALSTTSSEQGFPSEGSSRRAGGSAPAR
jgi:hypothetical protein